MWGQFTNHKVSEILITTVIIASKTDYIFMLYILDSRALMTWILVTLLLLLHVPYDAPPPLISALQYKVVVFKKSNCIHIKVPHFKGLDRSLRGRLKYAPRLGRPALCGRESDVVC